nr:hypothetical protein PJ912_03825 [Pectobacterium colocasium]
MQISHVNILDYFKANRPSDLYQCDSANVTGLPTGFGPSIMEWKSSTDGFGVLSVVDVTNPSRTAWVILGNGYWQGWVTPVVSYASTTRIPTRIIEINEPNVDGDYVIEYGGTNGTPRPIAMLIFTQMVNPALTITYGLPHRRQHQAKHCH